MRRYRGKIKSWDFSSILTCFVTTFRLFIIAIETIYQIIKIDSGPLFFLIRFNFKLLFNLLLNVLTDISCIFVATVCKTFHDGGRMRLLFQWSENKRCDKGLFCVL